MMWDKTNNKYNQHETDISIVNVNTIHSNMLQWGVPGKLACLSEFSERNNVSIQKPKERNMPLALQSIVM